MTIGMLGWNLIIQGVGRAPIPLYAYIILYWTTKASEWQGGIKYNGMVTRIFGRE